MKREDVTVLFENLVEFEYSEDLSILYSKTNSIWFIEDYSEDGRITILEDLENNIPLQEIFVYKDYEITKKQIEEYKEIVNADQGI